MSEGLVFNMVGGGGGGIKLTGIAIITPPAKTTYTAGETFDPAGMVVQATYSNGATLQATGYAYSPSTALTDGTTKVTIVYTEGGVSASAEQAITVVHRLESIAITTQPSKTVYEYGDSFVSAGMVVRATYSDGATANVTGYTYSPTALNTVGTQTITVSYTERGITKTTTLSVTVERKSLSTVPSQSGTLTYTGSAQSPSWSNYNSAQMTLGGVTSGTNAGSYNATFTPTANYRWSDGTTTAKIVTWTIGKAAGSLSISPTSMTLDTTNKTKTITVTRAGDGAITASSNNTAAATVSVSGNIVAVTGKASGSATITVSVAAGTNHNAPANKTCAVTVRFIGIYGVQWDGTSTTALTRTDAAAGFTNPVPAVNNGTGSSPFDNLLPWSGMTRITDSVAGELVAIPKFWYKFTKSGNTLKLQIADGQVDGFFVSPAHADRGDGNGERDIVYVGRYHCASNYKSTTGVAQKTNIVCSTARTNIHKLGAAIWQFDYAMRLTIQMLYLVEFADWNSQTKIGYGCFASGSKENNGQTDAMQYHTGTTAANRTTYGFTQYRYIEGLWDNVCDWMDGCYYNSSGMNIILNPSKFSDSANGTSIGTPPSGWISAFNVVESGGVQWLCPSGNSGSDSTYIPDFWLFNASYPRPFCGGYYEQNLAFGLFYVNTIHEFYTDSNIGCRLQKLP